MSPAQQIRAVLGFVVWLYLLVVIGRFIIDIVRSFAPRWRPTGVMVVVAEVLYTLTDPPLKALRRVIPPLDLGGTRLDLGGIVLIVALNVLLVIL